MPPSQLGHHTSAHRRIRCATKRARGSHFLRFGRATSPTPAHAAPRLKDIRKDVTAVIPPMDSAFRQSRRDPGSHSHFDRRTSMAGGQAADLPASAPGSLSSSPVRTGGISLSSRTAESRRLVEGRRRTWVVESTEANSPSEHSPLSDWGPATDARSDTDCESQSVSPSPQRGWLEQTGWDTTSAWDKLVARGPPGRGPSPLSARNGEQSSPFSFGRSPFSCDAPKRSSPVERRAPA